jgi:hypothetical protein
MRLIIIGFPFDQALIGAEISMIAQDIAKLNYDYLMLARLCANESPIEASLRFGLEPDEVEAIAGMSVERIREYAAAGMALFRVVPAGTPEKISGTVHVALMAQEGRVFAQGQGASHAGLFNAATDAGADGEGL